MKKALTILIPNYNRPNALARGLRLIAGAIDEAGVSEQVDVLVVDDFSDRDIKGAIDPFLSRREFRFALQSRKQGNAERAFLGALEQVETEYTWLLGNDDMLSRDSVGHVIKLLAAGRFGFILLNPAIMTGSAMPVGANPAGSAFWPKATFPIMSSSESILYATAEDLFCDFGFVTSTTTFPCLIVKTEPVRRFNAQHDLSSVATVYSHTFTVFGALRAEPAMFLSTPIVGFTQNDRLEEQDKLHRQVASGVMFYHQSLGLAKLIARCAEITGVPISRFGGCFEDEVDKDNNIVSPTLLSHFLTYFFLEQLTREAEASFVLEEEFRYMSHPDIGEIMQLTDRFEDDFISETIHAAAVMNHTVHVDGEWKLRYFRSLQREVLADAGQKYRKRSRCLPLSSPRKVLRPNLEAVRSRGVAGDRWGRPI